MLFPSRISSAAEVLLRLGRVAPDGGLSARSRRACSRASSGRLTFAYEETLGPGYGADEMNVSEFPVQSKNGRCACCSANVPSAQSEWTHRNVQGARR